jgi:hypothetical protein
MTTESLGQVSPVSPPVPRRAVQVGKMLAYFVMLCVGVRILEEIFKEISKTQYADELSRVSGMAASILDVNKNLDDLIVTFFALTITFLLILPVSWVHMITKGDERDPSLTQTLVVLSVIVAGVMLLLEDNLARSFSLVGVVAAVRYRNTLKDPKDAVYVFLSLGIGMACGLQSYHVALFLSFFECGILLTLWVYQTGAPAPGEANLLQTLKASENKGERTPAQALAWLTPEARERLEADLETQSRYITMAAMFTGKKGKAPNAVITVQLTGAGSARQNINAQMEEHRGKWRLLGTEEKDGITTLEYLGRLSKKRSPPLNFLERLRKADAEVRHVAFRSLRKMVADTASAPDPHAADPHGPPQNGTTTTHPFEGLSLKASDSKDSKSEERKGE